MPNPAGVVRSTPIQNIRGKLAKLIGGTEAGREVGGGTNRAENTTETPTFKPLLRELVEIKGPEKHDLTIEKFTTAPTYHKVLLDGLKYAHKKVNSTDPKPPDFDGSIPNIILKLYETQYGKVKDIDQITEKEMAAFMEKNGGDGVLLGNYMLEFKGLALSQGADLYFEVTDQGLTPPERPPKITGRKIEITPDGKLKSTKVEKKYGIGKNIKDWWKGTYKGKNAKLEAHFGDNFDVTKINSETAADFLKNSNVHEVDLKSDSGIEYVLDEFQSITDARQELFLQTGGKIQEFNPTFIDESGGLQGQNVHYLPEKSFGITYADMTFGNQEIFAKQVIKEIKNKITKEKTKKLKEDREKRVDEGSIFRLNERHKKIKEEADEQDGDEKQEKKDKKVIDKNDLDEKIKTIKRNELNNEEKKKAEESLKKAEARIIERNKQLTKGTNLLEWDGEGAQSCKFLNKEVAKLEKEKTKIDANIEKLEAKIDKIEGRRDSRLKAYYRKFTNAAGEETFELTSEGDIISKQIDKEIDPIKQSIKDEENKLADKTKYGGKTLEEEIDRLTELSTERQDVIGEEENAKLLTDHKTAKKNIEKLETEEKEDAIEITKLKAEFKKDIKKDPKDTAELKEFYRKKLIALNKEIKELEKNDPDVQAELDTILLLKESYSSDNKQQREQELFDWKQAVELGTEGEKILVPEELPEFDIYPPLVKQAMRLTFGEYIFSPSTAEQVIQTDKIRALLHSEKYLEIVVGAIEGKFPIITNKVAISSGPNESNKLKTDEEIKVIFAGSDIETIIDFKILDREFINNIITNLKERALQIS